MLLHLIQTVDVMRRQRDSVANPIRILREITQYLNSLNKTLLSAGTKLRMTGQKQAPRNNGPCVCPALGEERFLSRRLRTVVAGVYRVGRWVRTRNFN